MKNFNYFKKTHIQTKGVNYFDFKDLYLLDTDRERIEEIIENLQQDKLESYSDFLLEAVSDQEYFDHLDKIHDK
jgi:hypothetical protein